ncbi:armadillo-type protein [Mycena metata]|uniref:Armadillo-type protein n=1 Tax=Mycena metata TaxID=1033252 RepID=A0AAD7IB89_9AGAR|nr:armadillo-type protein [Mycena metata]
MQAAEAEALEDGAPQFNRDPLIPEHSRTLSRSLSARTAVPAYEAFSLMNSPPESAPPTRTQFGLSNMASPTRTLPEFSARSLYGNDTDSMESRNHGTLPRRSSLMASSSSFSSDPRSNNSSWTSTSSSRSAPNRLGSSGKDLPETIRSLPPIPSPIPEAVSLYSTDRRTAVNQTPHNLSAESLFSQPSSGSISTTTAPNATLIVGALLAEIKEGRQRDVVDPLIANIQKLGRRSHKDAQKLVTAGAIPALILLLKTRAVYGIGLEIVLVALGVLTHDPITANAIYRTNTTATLMSITDTAQTENIAALALWCLARISRNPEIATGLLKQNIGRLLVTKGIKSGQWRTSRMAAWCLGAMICSDDMADILADMGLVPTLCEHLERCSDSIDATPADQSAALYAVARISRSIKISKALAKCGCIEILAHLLATTEDPEVLKWSARAVGCLMRPNSSDMAKALLDAGIARGLARLPSVLATEEVEPLGAFAFAIQRFSCAEWGGAVRKILVDAGVVDSLLAALRTSADEPHPQVHIELAYAIALLSDIGGSSIRKEVVNAGGIDILKSISSSAVIPAVAKACNLAATSIKGNIWSRNTASAKAAMAHEWSGGCPDHLPECPVAMNEYR